MLVESMGEEGRLVLLVWWAWEERLARETPLTREVVVIEQ